MHLIMGDIHGNLEALKAVVSQALKSGPINKVFVLGDLVDYGADSVGVVDYLCETFREQQLVVVRGNHDDAVINQDCSRFRTSHGRQSFEKTYEELKSKPETFKKLEKLVERGCYSVFDSYNNQMHYFLHGTFDDELWGNIGCVSPFDEDSFKTDVLYDYLCFCGHSHIQGYKETIVGTNKTLLINPGSVGQPRNGDPRAQYLLVEEDWSTVYPRAVEYDIDTAARKIIDSGRPSFLATRLYLGI